MDNNNYIKRHWRGEAAPLNAKPISIKELPVDLGEKETTNIIRLPVTYNKEKSAWWRKKKNNVVSFDKPKEKEFNENVKYRVFEWNYDYGDGRCNGYVYEWSFDKKEIVDIVNQLNSKYEHYHKKHSKKGYFVQMFSHGTMKLLERETNER
jgi:allophanate hydrolase subunit 1